VPFHQHSVDKVYVLILHKNQVQVCSDAIHQVFSGWFLMCMESLSLLSI